MEYLYKLFELFVRGTCLFSHIYSFSHFYQHGLMDIYVVAWVVIQCCVISRLKLLQVCPLGTLSRLLLNPFDISCLCYFYLFFEQCHFFLKLKDYPALFYVLTALQPSMYSRSSGSFYWRIIPCVSCFSSVLCTENCGTEWIDLGPRLTIEV